MLQTRLVWLSQLRFFAETMLERIENVVVFEMLHQVTAHNMLKELTADTSKRNWTVVGRSSIVAFL